jgi:chromosome segregation ATPase
VFYDRLLEAPAEVLSQLVAECRLPLRLEAAATALLRAAVRPELKRATDGRSPAAGLSSGIDAVLEDGYRKLLEQRERGDFRRPIEAIAQAAYRPLMQAIPPWLGQELANSRAQAERAADAHAGARARVAALERELEQAIRVNAARDRAEADLQQRIETLSRGHGNEARDARMDATLVQLQGDLARLATTLADLPAREQALRIELGQAQRDLADERQTISSLSEAIEKERGVSQTQAQKLDLAQQHLQAMMAELDAARAAQNGWNEHHHALSHELDELRSRLDGVISERDGLRRERDETARQMKKLEVELDSARTDLRIVDHDRNALAARAQAVGDAASALREELARRAAAEAALAAERDRLGTELRKQADRLMVVERELARRMGELQALAGRHDMLNKTLAALERSWLGRQALAGTKRPAA